MCCDYQDDIDPTKFTRRSNMNKTTANMVPFIIRNLSQYPFEYTIGYDSNINYWNEASSQNYISCVPIPLLVCFMSDDQIPYDNTVSSLNVSLPNPDVMIIQTPCGGHIGWHSFLGGIHGHMGIMQLWNLFRLWWREGFTGREWIQACLWIRR